MRIQHNIMAMNAYRNYSNNTSALSKNLEKLSSGYKINRAGDDAAGLAISEKMRAQITGLDAAKKNAKDGISLVQTAEGALTEVHDMLNRMVYLASQSANGTYDSTVDRVQLQKEVEELRKEIDRIADSANFNGIKLLNGDMDGGGTVSTINGIDRILEGSNGKATGKGVADVGTKTILDGGAAATDTKTKFVVDFTGMTASLSAAGGGAGGGTAAKFEAAGTLPTGVKSVTGTAPADAADGAVKAEVTFAAAATGATVTGEDGLTGLTFTDGDNSGSVGNGINIKVVYDSTGTEGAAWDQASKTVTVTLDGTGGTAGVYSASDIQTMIQAVGDQTGADGIDFASFTVAGTGTVDTTAGLTDGDEVGAAALAGGADAGDATVTLSGGIAGTATVKAADWTGDKAVTINGLTVTFDTTVIDATSPLTATDIGTATAAVAGGGAGGGGTAPTDVKFSVKLNGEDLATDVTVADKADAKAIATAVFNALNGGTAVDIGVDGGTYKVTDNGDGTLTFELNEDPTEDNIKGNFTWDIAVADGAINGAHTGGTKVTTPGSVASAAMTANTVFEIKQSDLTDGTEITLNGTTVKLAVGKDSKLTGTGVVDLKDFEAGTVDIDIALGRISQAMGDTKEFIVGVNNQGADTTKGLTVQSKGGTNYDTIQKLAEQFSIKTKSAVDPSKGLTLQIGDTADSYNQLKVSIQDMHAEKLGIGSIDISSQTGAASAIDAIKAAINKVSDVRGTLGATQNRLDHTINNLSVMAENIQDAESTIRDTDIADEMMAYTKNNILIQSAQAMLAQANQVPQGVLQLLQ